MYQFIWIGKAHGRFNVLHHIRLQGFYMQRRCPGKNLKIVPTLYDFIQFIIARSYNNQNDPGEDCSLSSALYQSQ